MKWQDMIRDPVLIVAVIIFVVGVLLTMFDLDHIVLPIAIGLLIGRLTRLCDP
jgi:predicted PurR-regulated permease PerM